MTTDDEQLCARLERAAETARQRASPITGERVADTPASLTFVRAAARIRELNATIGEQARDSLAAERQADERIRELNEEVIALRLVISDADQDLRALRQRGGNGADGHLWQQLGEIADRLFDESIWLKYGGMQIVPRARLQAAEKMAEALRYIRDNVGDSTAWVTADEALVAWEAK